MYITPFLSGTTRTLAPMPRSAWSHISMSPQASQPAWSAWPETLSMPLPLQEPPPESVTPFMPWAAHEPPAPVATAVFFIPCAAQFPSAPAVIAVVFIDCIPQAPPASATTALARALALAFFAVVAEALAAPQSCPAVRDGQKGRP